MKALLLILALALAVSAQTADLKAKAKTFRNAKRFSIEYDKFKDQTHVRVGPFAVEVKGGMLGIYAQFLFPGEKVETPVDTFYLGIAHYGRGWQFLETDEVYLLIDGERLKCEADRGSKIGTSRRDVVTQEWLTVPLKAETLQKIVSGKSVELKAGKFEAVLKEEHQAAFRDLISLAN